jgi:DnaK suppressor protein
MKRSQVDKYRTSLLAKRAELLDRVRSARNSETQESDKSAPDLGDRAITTVSRDLLYQLTTGERDILRRIDAALDRIDAGTFGSCTNCGQQVQSGRLDAVPWARHCIECQELQDRGEI